VAAAALETDATEVDTGVAAGTGVESRVGELDPPAPSEPLGTGEGVSSLVAVDCARFAVDGTAVVADVSRGCALSTNTEIPATAISAAMVTTKNGRDGRAGMRLLVRARPISQRAQQQMLCQRKSARR